MSSDLLTEILVGCVSGWSVTLNSLETGPLGAELSPEEVSTRRTAMLIALAGETASTTGRHLTSLDRRALSCAVDAITDRPGPRPPTLVDVVDLLASPTTRSLRRSIHRQRSLTR